MNDVPVTGGVANSLAELLDNVDLAGLFGFLDDLFSIGDDPRPSSASFSASTAAADATTCSAVRRQQSHHQQPLQRDDLFSDRFNGSSATAIATTLFGDRFFDFLSDSNRDDLFPATASSDDFLSATCSAISSSTTGLRDELFDDDLFIHSRGGGSAATSSAAAVDGGLKHDLGSDLFGGEFVRDGLVDNLFGNYLGDGLIDDGVLTELPQRWRPSRSHPRRLHRRFPRRASAPSAL